MLATSTLRPCPVGLGFPVQPQHVPCRSVAYSLQTKKTFIHCDIEPGKNKVMTVMQKLFNRTYTGSFCGV